MVKITDKVYINARKVMHIQEWVDYSNYHGGQNMTGAPIFGSIVTYDNRHDIHIKDITPEQIFAAINQGEL